MGFSKSLVSFSFQVFGVAEFGTVLRAIKINRPIENVLTCQFFCSVNEEGV
jgi:hypothetical protein